MTDVRYTLVLFDLDHTLLDFDASESHALHICWERFFKDVSTFDDFGNVFRKINLRIWHEFESGKLEPAHVSDERARRCLKHFGLSGGTAEDLGKLYARGLGEVADWLPGAEEGFRNIADRYKVGLITNGLTEVQHPRLEAIGIKPLLATFQVSEEIGIMKPRAEIFFKAMNEAESTASTTLMVGDSVSSDFQGALNAKIDFCWVKAGGHDLPVRFPKPNFQVSTILQLDSLLP
jgi:YjjG family noncanonical pyrimidine nucleotidase